MEKKDKQAVVARQRSNVYGLLATLFGHEVSSELLQQIKDPRFLGVLSNMGLELESDFFEKPEEELIEDLTVEYAGLFLGPGEHISPHESVHHQRKDDQSGQLWGKSTVEVKNFIESAGLDYKEAYTGLPDHISVELEFMQQVTLREEQALSEDDQEGVLYCLKMEKKFIEEHLSRWIPAFCEKIISRAELPFYREMAALTNDFIQFENEEINKYINRIG